MCVCVRACVLMCACVRERRPDVCIVIFVADLSARGGAKASIVHILCVVQTWAKVRVCVTHGCVHLFMYA